MQNISLSKFGDALFAAKFLQVQQLYDILGRKALEFLELDVALKAFQNAKNLSMVLTLQSFQHENEKNLLFGNIAMILGHYDLA